MHLGIYTLDVVGVPVLVGIKTLHRLGAVTEPGQVCGSVHIG